MEEFCTCGARLPEDARFCHKCGRPLRLADMERELVVTAPPPSAQPGPSGTAPPPSAEPGPVAAAQPRAPSVDPSIGFRNPVTVRTALLASVLGFFVFGVVGQVSAPLSLLVMVAAGAFAVHLYRRRTGLPVSVRGGVHIGWITGIFAFVAAMVLVTVMAVALTNADFASVFESQLGARSSREIASEVLQSFRSAKGLTNTIAAFFFACGLMPTLGGAIGALLGRRTSA